MSLVALQSQLALSSLEQHKTKQTKKGTKRPVPEMMMLPRHILPPSSRLG